MSRRRVRPRRLTLVARDSAPSPADLVGRLARDAGTAAADRTWREVSALYFSGQADPEPAIRVVQALRDLDVLDEDAAFFLIGWLSEQGMGRRIERSPRLAELSERMHEIEHAEGVDDDDALLLDEAPPEYLALAAEWDEDFDREWSAWLRALGEPRMAAMNPRGRPFMTRWYDGRDALLGYAGERPGEDETG